MTATARCSDAGRWNVTTNPRRGPPLQVMRYYDSNGDGTVSCDEMLARVCFRDGVPPPTPSANFQYRDPVDR